MSFLNIQILVNHRHVVLTHSAVKLINNLFAHVYRRLMVVHRIADLNAPSAQSVHKAKLV